MVTISFHAAMGRSVIASILHGAYGDLYEQAICLKHFMHQHPDLELRLFASTPTRLEAFKALDLSFAISFELWTEIASHPDIERFHQFQVLDEELIQDVLDKLPPGLASRIDRSTNHLPWVYLRDNHLIPTPATFQLQLSPRGEEMVDQILSHHAITRDLWSKPAISFLWRYRGNVRGQAVSGFGQASQEQMVESYSLLFRRLLRENDCHLVVFGMNVVTTDSNRARLDNKYPPFGLDVPAERTTYMQGLNWPAELEIASWGTVCCGNASGFTEALWLKRGAGMVLMDAPYHYLLKAAFRRMPIFNLNKASELFRAFVRSPEDSYVRVRRNL